MVYVCPAVSRWYFVDAAPVEVYAQAEQAVIGAGFHIEQGRPECDGKPSGSACYLIAVRDGPIRLAVFIHNPGYDIDPGKGETLVMDRTTVVVRAEPANG
jgi:hypothetical protein